MSAITRVGTVIVPVSDQDRALEFYVGTLGFEKRLEAPFGDGMRWIEVAPAGSTTTIALPPQGDAPVGVDTGIRLRTDSAADDHALLKAAGVDVDQVQRMGDPVPPMFFFRDPDGNNYFVAEDP